MVEPIDPDDRGLHDHGPVDLSAARPERPQQCELPAALGDQHAERVEDDERADEDRDRREDEQEGAEEAQRVLDVAGV